MGRLLGKWELSDRAFVAVTFGLHAAITLWVTLHHEAWLDEADVWLVMRDGDLGAIFGLTAYTYRGTPLLWYLLVWPFAALGAPYVAQQLLNLAISWAAVLLVLRRAPMPRLVRALFAFSYYPAFEYSVIARNYALVMLLLFLMADQWKNREEKPMRLAVTLALLANASVHGLIIAAVAGMLLALESRLRHVGAVAVAVAGGLLSTVQLWPQMGGQVVPYLVQFDTVWYSLASAAFPQMGQSIAAPLAAVVFGIVVAGVSRSPVPILLFVVPTLLLLAVFTIVWMGGLRHAGLLTVVMIAVVWIARAYGPLRHELLTMVALAVAVGYSILPAAQAWISETRFAYSGSREIAGLLRERGLDRETLVLGPGVASSLLVYLPNATLLDASYAGWDREWQVRKELPLEAAVARAKEHFGSRRWLLVLTKELPPEMALQLRPVVRTRTPIWEKFAENFAIYEPVPPP